MDKDKEKSRDASPKRQSRKKNFKVVISGLGGFTGEMNMLTMGTAKEALGQVQNLGGTMKFCILDQASNVQVCQAEIALTGNLFDRDYDADEGFAYIENQFAAQEAERERAVQAVEAEKKAALAKIDADKEAEKRQIEADTQQLRETIESNCRTGKQAVDDQRAKDQAAAEQAFSQRREAALAQPPKMVSWKSVPKSPPAKAVPPQPVDKMQGAPAPLPIVPPPAAVDKMQGVTPLPATPVVRPAAPPPRPAASQAAAVTVKEATALLASKAAVKAAPKTPDSVMLVPKRGVTPPPPQKALMTKFPVAPETRGPVSLEHLEKHFSDIITNFHSLLCDSAENLTELWQQHDFFKEARRNYLDWAWKCGDEATLNQAQLRKLVSNAGTVGEKTAVYPHVNTLTPHEAGVCIACQKTFPKTRNWQEGICWTLHLDASPQWSEDTRKLDYNCGRKINKVMYFLNYLRELIIVLRKLPSDKKSVIESSWPKFRNLFTQIDDIRREIQ